MDTNHHPHLMSPPYCGHNYPHSKISIRQAPFGLSRQRTQKTARRSSEHLPDYEGLAARLSQSHAVNKGHAFDE